MNFYKHHIGDYSKKTAHLTLVEHGAYLLLLQHYYATEEPLPRDLKMLARIIRADSPPERKAIERVLREFWLETDDGWINGRALEEIGRADHQRGVNQELGKRGGSAYLKDSFSAPGSLYAARLHDGRIKVGVTTGPWSKRAYRLAQTYGSRPELLALVEVENMAAVEADVLAKFAREGDGDVIELDGESPDELVAYIKGKGTVNPQPNRMGNPRANPQPIPIPIQTPDSIREKEKLTRPAKGDDFPPLPEWLPAPEWAAFLAHRKAMKAAMTAEAQRRALAQLDRLRADGHDPLAVINQSIVSGWKGLFPTDSNGASHGTRRESAAERHDRANAIHQQALAIAAQELGGGLRGEDAPDVPRAVDLQVVRAR